jgi:hypothetical protein
MAQNASLVDAGEALMTDSRISLKIDVRAGTIELDSPAESFDQAIARTKELAEGLDFRPAPAELETAPPASTERAEEISASVPSKENNAPARVRGRSGKGSSGRPGRIGSFEEVRGLLTEDQEIELRAFFAEKRPREQPHQVLVALVKGEQLLERRGFSYNEIYTLMWLAGAKPLPKALDVTLSRMAQEQFVVREGAGFAAKFIGRDFVERELPPQAKTAS